MGEMSAEYVNPFLVAASSVLQSLCGVQLKPGKPYVRTTAYGDESVVISIGITGQLGGQVLIALHREVACEIASKMCMMPIEELNEISLSALSELGNMILGNAATVLSTKGITIDITPPVILHGNFTMDRVFAQNICIPMSYDGDKTIEIDVSIVGE